MKSKFKIYIIMALIVIFMPSIVKGAEYNYLTVNKDTNITKIPLGIIVKENEVVTNGKFGCKTDNTDITCSIEKGTVINGNVDATGTLVFSTANLSQGNYTIATLVLNNSSNSKKSVKVELVDPELTYLDGTKRVDNEGTIYINTEVGAKPVERTLSSLATLSSVKISQGTMSPEFNKDVTDYTIYNIADTINSLKISGVCSDINTCSISIVGGKSVSGNTVTLNQGENKVTLNVTSEDGNNSLAYNFTIYRGETAYNSAKLSSMSFGDYILTPAFNKDTLEYKVIVPNKVNSLSSVFQYTLEDEKANVDIKGLDNLVIGENTLSIKVDNVNGDQTVTYTVVINRMSDEDIEIIKYFDHEITFKDSEGIEQTLSEDEFKIQYEDEWEKILNNEYEFDDQGNVIVEEDVKEKEDKKEEKESKSWLIILLIVIGLIIIGVSGFLIFKKKKNNKKDDKKEQNKMEDTNLKNEAIEEKKIDQNLDDDSKEESQEYDENEEIDPNKTMEIDEALTELMNTNPFIK